MGRSEEEAERKVTEKGEMETDVASKIGDEEEDSGI